MAVRRSSRSADEVAPPQLSPLALRNLTDAGADALHRHAVHEGLHLTSADVSGWDLSGIALSECLLSDVLAHETDLQGARLTETRIERLGAPVLKAGRSVVHDVEVVGSRIGAFELFDADLDSVLFEGCKLDWLNLRGAHLADVVLRDCTLAELDLGGVSAQRVAFENCRAGTVTFAGARLRDVDLRGLEVEMLQDLDGMRGAVMSTAQATAFADVFAAHLGVRVRG